MFRLALAAGGGLAVVALAIVLYASTREERSEEPEPPASEDYSIVNDGVAAARTLHVEGHFGGVEIVENAPGCAAPKRTAFGLFEATFEWSAACIDPGEHVVVRSTGDCPECTGPVTGWRWEGVDTTQ